MEKGRGEGEEKETSALLPVLPVELRVRGLNVWIKTAQKKHKDIEGLERLTQQGESRKDKKGSPASTSTSSSASSLPPEEEFKREDGHILHDINGFVPSGSLLIILGTSGSGKTTFLNTLAGRIADKKDGARVSGQVRFFESLPLAMSPSSSSSVGASTSARLRTVNGQELQRRTAYVMQNDCLLPNLTVLETLTFAGLLRLPRSLSKQQKIEIVKRVMIELGLKECAHRKVGNQSSDAQSGQSSSSSLVISGGERRRVSIGVQLLTDPSVLFLDEPTSGLDSFTANRLIKTLLSMAHAGGRTVLCTIHQPRTEILKMADQILILSKGRVVFWGPPSTLSSYFSTVAGCPIPRLVNPADFLLDLVSLDPRSPLIWRESSHRLHRLLECWSNSAAFQQTKHLLALRDPLIASRQLFDSFASFFHLSSSSSSSSSSASASASSFAIDQEMISDEIETNQRKGDILSINNNSNKNESGIEIQVDIKEETKDKEMTVFRKTDKLNWFQAVAVLGSRTFKNLIRSPLVTFTRASQLLSFGIILSLCYLRIPDDQIGIQNKKGFLYECLSLVFIGFLNAVALFPPERNTFYRERQDGLYSTGAFLTSYMMAEIPIDFLSCLAYAILTYAIIGLKMTYEAFFIYLLVLFCVLFSGESFGIMLCSAFYDIGVANSLAAIIFSLFMLMSGFFRPINSLPVVLRWIDYSMITSYATSILAINEFEGETFTCDNNNNNDLNHEPVTFNETFVSVNQNSNPNCRFTTGDQVLNALGINPDDFWWFVGGLIALTFLYRLLAYLILRFRRVHSIVS